MGQIVTFLMKFLFLVMMVILDKFQVGLINGDHMHAIIIAVEFG